MLRSPGDQDSLVGSTVQLPLQSFDPDGPEELTAPPEPLGAPHHEAHLPPGVERVVFMPHPGNQWVFDIAAYSNPRASSRDFVGNITIDRIAAITPACLSDDITRID